MANAPKLDSEVIPPEQMEQLLDVLLACIRRGYGIVEIEVKDHHIKEFRDVRRIPACRTKVDDQNI